MMQLIFISNLLIRQGSGGWREHHRRPMGGHLSHLEGSNPHNDRDYSPIIVLFGLVAQQTRLIFTFRYQTKRQNGDVFISFK